jgi:hypothetical protein
MMGMSNYIIDLQQELCECNSCGESVDTQELSELELCEHCQQQEYEDNKNHC